MLSRILSKLQQLLNLFDYELVHLKSSTQPKRVLKEMFRLIKEPSTIIDVGASDGSWSLPLTNIFTNSNFLLFEAAYFHFDKLRLLEKSHNFLIEYRAASNQKGTVKFHMDENNPLGGGASTLSSKSHTTEVASVSIDEVIEEKSLSAPYLLKLDAQGHEAEILEGATETLKNTEMIIIEVYTIGEPGRLEFDEICSKLKLYGFRVAGIMGILKRPKDNVFWQADLVFVRSDNSIFDSHEFRKIER